MPPSMATGRRQGRDSHGAIELELLVVHVGGKAGDVADENSRRVSTRGWRGWEDN